MQTCPAIANRIAGAWANRQETLEVLDELVAERRDGCDGFPPFVLAELLWLRDLAAQRATVRGLGPQTAIARAIDHGQRQPREEGVSLGHSAALATSRRSSRTR
jgi:hypothetical protein